MSSIIASNIPTDVTSGKIEEFFSFCGKIKSIESVESQSDSSSKAVKVVFENQNAVSTALLLNGAELGSNSIKVIEESGGVKSKVIEAEEGTKSSGSEIPPPPTYQESSSSGDNNDEDVEQEYKPKTAIIAQYLSHGYVLSDQLIDKAVQFDKEQGYSSKFKNFLTGLDSKYHLQDKSQQLQQNADDKLHLQDNLSQGKSKLDHYYDKFKQDKYGSKIHQFYQGVVNDTKDVHEEARRLADLKKQQEPGYSAVGGTTESDGPAIDSNVKSTLEPTV